MKEGEYGIFSDTVSSITQALGRQRNGGECHVIMGRPLKTIKGTELRKPAGEAFTFAAGDRETFKSQNRQLLDITELFQTCLSGQQEDIAFLRGNQSTNPAQCVSSHYPSLQDSLLTESKEALVSGSLSGGSGLSAYMLWAACNNQFEGVTLKAVKSWYLTEKVIRLSNHINDNWDQLTG
jgi:hypothetical protein